MKFGKMVVTFILRSGKEVRVKCKDIKITRRGNELVSYTLEGVDTRPGDPIFYLNIESIDHISYRRVFW